MKVYEAFTSLKTQNHLRFPDTEHSEYNNINIR